MSSITPELADKLLEADAALAFKKLQDGKGITSSQRAYLLSVAGHVIAEFVCIFFSTS